MPYIRLLSEGEVPVALLSESTQPLAPASTPAIGTSTYAARADHVHPEQEINIEDALSVSDPQPNGTASPGMSLKAAREDHVHPTEALALSDDNPSAPGVASPGVSTEPSRSDHVHPEQVIPESPTVAEQVIAASSKTTPVSADLFPILDSAASNTLKKLTLANLITSFSMRPRLTSNTTLYVRSDGSDSNDGATNTAGGAFLTIQKGMDAALAYDLNGYDLIVQVGAGTYAPVHMENQQTGSGSITLSGDVTTPSNVVISSSSDNCINVSNCAKLNVRGFRLTHTGSNSLIFAETNSVVYITGNMDFGPAGGYGLMADYNGVIRVISNYKITGGSIAHYCGNRGGLVVSSGVTVTITNTPAFTVAFVLANTNGMVIGSGNTFSGATTGMRYYGALGGIIQTAGSGANYYPGNSSGSLDGGLYN